MRAMTILELFYLQRRIAMAQRLAQFTKAENANKGENVDVSR